MQNAYTTSTFKQYVRQEKILFTLKDTKYRSG